jgi:hypothetical protein
VSLNRILVCIAALIAGCDGNLYSRTSVRFTASVVDDDEHPETFGSGVLFADQLPERFTEVTIGRRECVPYDSPVTRLTDGGGDNFTLAACFPDVTGRTRSPSK